MNPLSLFKTLWAHKLIALPIVLLIAIACGYALFYGPRSYESTASYVLITPGMPTESQMDADPSLAQKADNPYLRAVDPSLAAQVVIARLGAADIGETLVEAGLSADYAVLPASEFGSGQIIRVSASADTPQKAEETAGRLGDMLVDELLSIQDKNGGDPSYYLTAQAITNPTAAAERVSSRLRTVAMVGIAGVVLLFGAVSLARALDDRRRPAPGRHEEELAKNKRLDDDHGGPATTDVDMLPTGSASFHGV